jgi:DNA-binding transcriptional ArsR family regulator
VEKEPGHVELVHDARGALAMLGPLRIQILEGLRSPNSASGVARDLGLPRQKVNYHLRELEKHGFIEPVEERRRGNCVERIVQATARYYLILPQALGQLAADPETVQDRFSSTYLLAVAAQAIQDLAHLRQRAKEAEKKLATLTLQADLDFASAAERNAFAEELSNQIAKLIRKYHRDRKGGRRFRMFLGLYPAVARKEQKNEQDSKDRKND